MENRQRTQNEIKKSRHKWNKKYYNGKYSSFEVDATCIKCGCKRKKMFMGYEYITKKGEASDNAPNCKGK